MEDDIDAMIDLEAEMKSAVDLTFPEDLDLGDDDLMAEDDEENANGK